MTDLFVLVNGELIPDATASLLISDLSIQRGYGIFDYFKTVNGRPVFLEAHLDRFFHSAAQLRLDIGQDRQQLTTTLQQLQKKNDLPDCGIRLTLTGGYSEDGYTLAKPNLIITQKPLQIPASGPLTKSISLITHQHQRQMPDTKTIDYLMAIWLQPKIKEQKADDVLYHNNGVIAECPRSNFFFVTKDDTLVTPANNILKGIIRKNTLELAITMHKVEERDCTLEELKMAKEAFITSTTKHILPVSQIDGAVIGNGKPGRISQWCSDAINSRIAQDA